LGSQVFPFNSLIIKQKALQFASANYTYVCYLEGNDLPYLHGGFPNVLAFGAKKLLSLDKTANAFEQLNKFQLEATNTIFGFLGYDLKNELENLESNNSDRLKFPQMLFFEPLYLVEFHKNEFTISGENPRLIFDEINKIVIDEKGNEAAPTHNLQSKIAKESYVNKVKAVQNHIVRGDIYELNFCQEFFIENIELQTVASFVRLNKISPMPFASFLKAEDKYLLCASPERFLKKEGQKIISQPIKGTVKRGENEAEDQRLIYSLLHSEKELAENVMIVDLVRNDLSKTAKDGSVRVEELFGLYSFSNVHQMISTIVAEQGESSSAIDVIQTAFPMGSMTGAPKISAMQLIEKYEETQRGLFSGAVGYISKKQNFDFNVVIRSILYNESSKYLSFQVGSAITIDADAENEWEECEVKISAIKKALNLL